MPIKKLGIQCPVVITENPIVSVNYYPEATAEAGGGVSNTSRMPAMGAGGLESEPAGPKMWKLRKYDFTIQFFWKPTPRTARQAPPATAEGEATDTAVMDGAAGPTG